MDSEKSQFVAELGTVISKYCKVAVVSMSYDEKEEQVIVNFKEGRPRHINVALDSCYGILCDIVKAFEHRTWLD